MRQPPVFYRFECCLTCRITAWMRFQRRRCTCSNQFFRNAKLVLCDCSYQGRRGEGLEIHLMDLVHICASSYQIPHDLHVSTSGCFLQRWVFVLPTCIHV